MKEKTYYVKGMHCASCEILIEKKLTDIKRIKSVDASTGKQILTIEYEGDAPNVRFLNELFQKEGYTFSEGKEQEQKKENSLPLILATALSLIAIFLLLKQLGLDKIISVNSKSSLIMFLFLGIIAGISSCAALVGGLILSLSKQWLLIYSKEQTLKQKLQPHLMFNAGRIASYSLFGAILGLLGSKIQASLSFAPFLAIAVSAIMLITGLQMLGVKYLKRFQITAPRALTRYVADEKNFKAKYMPFLVGALTFFLPCGFTITAQGLALISGSALQGLLIMLFFSLGTLPVLLLIGVSSIKLFEKPHFSKKFLTIAGTILILFAVYNTNAQFNVLGYTSLTDIKVSSSEDNLAPVVDGFQIMKMKASSSGYSPNYFKIKAGIPVKWEITVGNISGCTNAIIARGLFDGNISLIAGQNIVKEFTPTKAGRYKFSCWMGMVSGTIEVIN